MALYGAVANIPGLDALINIPAAATAVTTTTPPGGLIDSGGGN